MPDANTNFAPTLTKYRLEPVIKIARKLNLPYTEYESSLAITSVNNGIRDQISIRVDKNLFKVEVARHKVGLRSQRLLSVKSATLDIDQLSDKLLKGEL